MSLRCVLFDLDGTLTDPAEGITNSVAHALRRMGLPVPPAKELYCYIGPPLAYGFTEFAGVPEERAADAVAYYREYFADRGIFENELYAGVPELLSGLKDAGCGVYLATSKPTVYAKRILEHFGIADSFDGAVGSELDGRRTDKAEVIAHLLEKYRLPREGTVMVGDRKFDILGAAAVGIEAIGVSYGYGSTEELSEAGASVIASSPSELRTLLGEI